jgi:hypothetical protein
MLIMIIKLNINKAKQYLLIKSEVCVSTKLRLKLRDSDELTQFAKPSSRLIDLLKLCKYKTQIFRYCLQVVIQSSIIHDYEVKYKESKSIFAN